MHIDRRKFIRLPLSILGSHRLYNVEGVVYLLFPEINTKRAERTFFAD